MKLKSTKLKHNPFRLNPSNQPKWLRAVSLHPPAPKPTRGAIPSKAGMFAATELPIFSTQEIKYKEDEIRDMFYRQHPFELHRPRSLIEFDVTWDSIHGTPAVPLSGESVVQYTLELSKSKRISLDQAYQLALQQFYEARQQQENQEYQTRKKRIDELKEKLLREHKEEHLGKVERGELPEETPIPELEYDPLLGLPFASRFMELESMELQQGLEYKKSLVQMQ
jgi:hypothetical protein